MGHTKNVNFGNEVAKLMPAMLREVSKRHQLIYSQGNLAISHIVTLDLLRQKGPCKMSELAKTLNLTMSAATGIVDRMIKMGLVKRERSRKDRRVVRVALLKKGEETARRVNENRRSLTNKMFTVLTQKEKQEYLRLLRKVYESLKKKR